MQKYEGLATYLLKSEGDSSSVFKTQQQMQSKHTFVLQIRPTNDSSCHQADHNQNIKDMCAPAMAVRVLEPHRRKVRLHTKYAASRIIFWKFVQIVYLCCFIHSSVFSLEGWAWQEPEPSHVTGMALAHCILGKFLGVVCHCFPPPLDVPTLAARCLRPQRRERS